MIKKVHVPDKGTQTFYGLNYYSAGFTFSAFSTL